MSRCGSSRPTCGTTCARRWRLPATWHAGRSARGGGQWHGVAADQRWAMEVLGLRAGMEIDREDVNRRFRRMLRDAHPDSGGAAGRGRGAYRRAHRGPHDPPRSGFVRGRRPGLVSPSYEATCTRRRHGRSRPDRLQPPLPHRQRRPARARPAGDPAAARDHARAARARRRRDGARRLRVPARRRRSSPPTTPTPRSTASTTRCSSARARARRAWSARSCSRSTARSSPRRARRSRRAPPTTCGCSWWAIPRTPTA